MFGLFRSKKTFEEEMLELAEEAKELGKKYPLDKVFGDFNMSFTDQMQIQMKLMNETGALNKKRIECCKKHNKREDQKVWEEQIQKAKKLIG
jgi:hypothetical protein